jgi:hypothetical protein
MSTQYGRQIAMAAFRLELETAAGHEQGKPGGQCDCPSRAYRPQDAP